MIEIKLASVFGYFGYKCCICRKSDDAGEAIPRLFAESAYVGPLCNDCHRKATTPEGRRELSDQCKALADSYSKAAGAFERGECEFTSPETRVRPARPEHATF